VEAQLAYPYPVEEINMCANGETLLHPQLAQVIAMCHAAHPEAKVRTVTSGMVEPSQSAGLDDLGISMSGATRETFEVVRRLSDFDTVIETTRAAVRIIPRVGFVYTATALNLHELPAVVRLARHLGVKEVYVQPFAAVFGSANIAPHLVPDNLPRTDRERFVSEAESEANRLGVDFHHSPGVLPNVCTDEQRQNCAVPWTQVGMVQPAKTGYVIWPCCWIAQRRVPELAKRYGWEFESIPDLDALFNGAGYKQFRADKLSGDDVCADCQVASGLQR
jgi:MoaA/NifB/PqqE/SkfB family radical SAM enzyme